MKVKICDRCKKIPSQTIYEEIIFSIQYEFAKSKKTNTFAFLVKLLKLKEWCLGRKITVDLCEKCFDDFWDFNNYEKKDNQN